MSSKFATDEDESKSGSSSSWLKRQFSSQDSPEEPWPDLLVDRRPLQEKKIWRSRDPLEIERNNLIAISQLVMKAVVDSSLRLGRQVDLENLPLRQFFVILDLAFRHGFKSGRSLVFGKRDVWDLLQNIEKFDPAAAEITASAKELPTVRTNQGRARAWFRLALMQKKLGDYVKLLVEKKADLLVEYYDTSSLLCSDEGILLAGLILSLNIVDFNLCVKDEDLDSQEGVIDLSLYLRRKEDIGRTDSQEEEEGQVDREAPARLATLLDQKNYVEELNRSLAANVLNLQARVDNLNSKNALLREDVALSGRRCKQLEEENRQLAQELEQHIIQAKLRNAEESSGSSEGGLQLPAATANSELEAQLATEERRLADLEKELKLEMQMKAEMEVAMKLLEKDVHEKQDTIVSLRCQLEDIKGLNLELNTKLAESQRVVRHKTEIIHQLETKTLAMTDTLEQLDVKYVETEKLSRAANRKLQDITTAFKELEGKMEEMEGDSRIEKEWRERLQETGMVDKQMIASLREENDFLKQVSNDYENLRQENIRLKEGNRESEQTLEELGMQLSWAKLQLDTLKEEAKIPGAWEKDAEAVSCKICAKEFNLGRRKHHCRNCGGIFCDACSDNKMKLPSSAKPLRVCDNCFTVLLDRQSKLP